MRVEERGVSLSVAAEPRAHASCVRARQALTAEVGERARDNGRNECAAWFPEVDALGHGTDEVHGQGTLVPRARARESWADCSEGAHSTDTTDLGWLGMLVSSGHTVELPSLARKEASTFFRWGIWQ